MTPHEFSVTISTAEKKGYAKVNPSLNEIRKMIHINRRTGRVAKQIGVSRSTINDFLHYDADMKGSNLLALLRAADLDLVLVRRKY